MNKKLIAFIEKLPGWLTIQEGIFLEYASQKTKAFDGAIVEIGSYCGKSTIWLAQSGKTVYSIDPHKGNVGVGEQYPPTYASFIKNLKHAKVDNHVVSLVKTSEKAANGWKKKIKVLFIDGLHDEKNASLDFHLWSKHVVEGGIIAIHDSHKRWCGSETIALRKIALSSEFIKIGTIDSITYGIKGKANLLQTIRRTVTAFAIVGAVYLNRLKILILHAPEILTKHFNKSQPSVR